MRLLVHSRPSFFFLPRHRAAQTPQRQTQEDDYTRYELLGPDTAQFRILYEVTATTAGAPFFFNAIRKGSIATDERVADMMTGQPLKWEIVSGAQARKEGHPTADLETEWLKVHLARPVPKGGEARVLIDKTYKDPKSYFRDGDTIVFDRSLGIRRNAVVLPAGYRLISCNVPSQVMSTADGRVMITFMNPGAGRGAARDSRQAGPGAVHAEGVDRAWSAKHRHAGIAGGAPVRSRAPGSRDRLLSERSRRRTRSASITTTPSRVRASAHYFNVVRAGSTVSNPSAVLLDTGEPLKVETISGAELKKRGLDAGEPVADTTQIVVISFPPIKHGQSARLRITETYTDPGRYLLDGDELVWDRAFGRPRNTVVLPAGLDRGGQLDPEQRSRRIPTAASACSSRTIATTRSRC